MNVIAFAPLAAIDDAVAGAAGIPLAFLIGMISFFSPCILPLVPGYLSFMSGVSGEDLASGVQKRRVLAATLLFVLGFALIFTALGATASAFGGLLLDHFVGLQRVAGAIVIVMGLAFMTTLFVKPLQGLAGNGGPSAALGRGLLKVAAVFSAERGVHAKPRAGLVGALPLGAAFAVSWTPCVGPGLATILTIASTEGSAAQGAVLLFSFSLGFGVWFVLGGVGFRKAMGAFAAVRRHMRVMTAVGGAFLLTIGVLMVTNRWNDVIAPIRRLVVNFAPPI
ncbi:MAG TPA: cytochrome c biogenesis protein CcdA [Actinomycetota bacterium]